MANLKTRKQESKDLVPTCPEGMSERVIKDEPHLQLPEQKTQQRTLELVSGVTGPNVGDSVDHHTLDIDQGEEQGKEVFVFFC